jgi:Arc/MetJ-type ribon-helix-helix transcriptional regulator
MSISIPRDIETQVRKLVDERVFVDSDEAIRAAVQLLETSIKNQTSLREMVQSALHQVKDGEAVPWSDELGDEIWNDAKEPYRRKESPGADVLP